MAFRIVLPVLATMVVARGRNGIRMGHGYHEGLFALIMDMTSMDFHLYKPRVMLCHTTTRVVVVST